MAEPAVDMTVLHAKAGAMTLANGFAAVALGKAGPPDRDEFELLPRSLVGTDGGARGVYPRRNGRKVTALDLGAVDYVTKPFDTSELRAGVTGDGGQTSAQC